jgi:hypothetical protein
VVARDQRYYYPVVLSLIVSLANLCLCDVEGVYCVAPLVLLFVSSFLLFGWGVVPIWAQKLEKFV